MYSKHLFPCALWRECFTRYFRPYLTGIDLPAVGNFCLASKGGRPANKFRKMQMCRLKFFYICGPSANVAFGGFAICGPNTEMNMLLTIAVMQKNFFIVTEVLQVFLHSIFYQSRSIPLEPSHMNTI